MRSRFALVLLVLLGLYGIPVQADDRVVIPFDFESKFDGGRYGRMVGDMVWKKLDRQGGFVIPESMLDVRDWQQRRRIVPNHETPLEQMQQFVRDDFGADVGIWGKIERVAGHEWDVYDVWIRVADFSAEPPRIVYQKEVRTKTVSEIPHVYVMEALDTLYERQPEEETPPNADAERRWQQSPNLVHGDFERGTPGPEGWDPPPPYVQRVAVRAESGQANHVMRFQFPKNVAASSGVLYYSNYFPVEENATYRFQCRWRSTGSAVKVFIKCYDEMPTRFREQRREPGYDERREVYRSQQNLKGPAKTWNVQTQDFTPRHTQFSPRWGRVMLYAYWPEGTVDFDDVVVKQIAPPPAQQTPKTRRPSLETRVTSEEVENAREKRK